MFITLLRLCNGGVCMHDYPFELMFKFRLSFIKCAVSISEDFCGFKVQVGNCNSLNLRTNQFLLVKLIVVQHSKKFLRGLLRFVVRVYSTASLPVSCRQFKHSKYASAYIFQVAYFKFSYQISVSTSNFCHLGYKSHEFHSLLFGRPNNTVQE